MSQEGGDGEATEDDSFATFRHSDAIFAVAACAGAEATDPCIVATGCGDDAAYLWNADTGEQIASLKVATPTSTRSPVSDANQ